MTVYKECNLEGKFQSLEMFTKYKYIEYIRKEFSTDQVKESIKNLVMNILTLISSIPYRKKIVI
ncbi:hypothetical protein H8356DRAFT_1708246 [Neocallimastix lanati (nom. inval.)]|nr:hypothetical protein H8356DRAFT_1708246 [Neocallimastix sp. JGI-2020a]